MFSTAELLSKEEARKPILEHEFSASPRILPDQRVVNELYTLIQSDDPWLFVKFTFLWAAGKYPKKSAFFSSQLKSIKAEAHPEMREEFIRLVEDLCGNTFDRELDELSHAR